MMILHTRYIAASRFRLLTISLRYTASTGVIAHNAHFEPADRAYYVKHEG